MSGQESVIAALKAALEQQPDDRGVRLHLGQLLLEEGCPDDALHEAEFLIKEAPADGEALRLAFAAADAAGQEDRAVGYGRLLAALNVESAPQTPVEPEREDPVKLFAVRPESGMDLEVEKPVIRLDDVAGMVNAKRRLRTAFLAPLENPALRRLYGKSLRGGLLLYGPPGCGKTFLARATAGELGAKFIAVGLHEVLDMYMGETERKLHEVFENARRQAPCVLFFDEVDSLGRRRTQLRNSGGRDVIVQFLSELDSFGADNEGVFVLAATNHPWDVDPALRRPGRLDRTLLVLPPDKEARASIFEMNLRDRPTAEIDFDRLAGSTELFSGADIAHVCETAAEFALEDSIESGVPRPITTDDLDRALAEVPASTVAWLHIARNFAEFSIEGGVFDDLLVYLREHRVG